MNRTLDPCRFFYEYVCGNWERVHPGAVHTFQVIEKAVLDTVNETIKNAHVNPFRRSATERVTAAVQSCWAVASEKQENLAGLSDFLRRHDIDLPPTRTQGLPSPIDVMMKLNLLLNIRTVLFVQPGLDLRTQDRMILTFHSNEDFIEDILTWFQLENPAPAIFVNGQSFARDVVQVHDQFQYWHYVARSTSPSYMTVHQIAEETPYISAAKWTTAINSGLLEPISTETTFYVRSRQTLEIVNLLMRDYRRNPKPALNWITMLVHFYFASASSYQLQQTFGNLPSRCMDYMTYIAPHALNVLVTEHKVSTDDVQTAKHIFQHMKRASGAFFSWMDNRTRALALRRFDKLSLTLGVPRKFYSPAILEKEYAFLPLFRGTFLEELLNAFRDKARIAIFEYTHGPKGQKMDRDVLSFDLIAPITNAYFVRYIHAIYFPTVILAKPLLVVESLAATYGSFGSILGHEIGHAFDPMLQSTDPGGRREEWMSSESRRDYRARIDCVIRLYGATGVQSHANYSMATLNENFADILGLQIALAALQSDSCVRLDAESPLKGFTNRQLFYESTLELMQKAMNRTLDPCRFFYEYVCGNWERAHPGAVDTFQVIEQAVLDTVNETIKNARVNPFRRSATERVTAAVQSCWAVASEKQENLAGLSDFLRRHNIDLPPTRTEGLPSPIDVMMKLNLLLNIRTVLFVQPELDLRSQDRMILTFHPNNNLLKEFLTALPGDNRRRKILGLVAFQAVFLSALSFTLVLLRSSEVGKHETDTQESTLELMQKAMNRTLDPCRFFYEYVCGNWERVHPGAVHTFQVIEKAVLDTVNETIKNAHVNPFRRSATERVTAAVQSCWAVASEKQENLAGLSDFLRRHDIDLPPTRTQGLPSPIDVMMKLNLLLNIRTVLFVQPGLDLRTQDRMILTFHSNEDFIEDILTWFQLENPAPAIFVNGQSFARDVVQVHDQFQYWHYVARSTSPSYMTVHQIAEETPYISAAKWTTAINSGLLEPISTETTFYVRSRQTLEIVNLLMRDYRRNPKPALNWITMLVHFYFASASSYQLQQTFGNLPSRCMDYMTYIAPHALNVLVTEHKVSTDDVQTAKHIFQHMKRASGAFFSWMDNRTRALALRRFDKLSLTLGVPRKFYSPAILEKEYAFLPLFRGTFLEELLNAFRDKARIAIFEYTHGPKGQKMDRDVLSFDLIAPITNAYFVRYIHAIYFPTVILAKPLLVVESLAATYGSFGSILGHEIGHAFDPMLQSTDPGGRREEWMSSESRRDYRARIDCVIRLYGATDVQSHANYSMATLNENFADILGLQIALAALQSDSCVRLDAESPLKGFTNRQLFYVSFCSQYCANRWYAYNYFGENHAKFYHRCVVVLKMFDDFARTFRCSGMTPAPCTLL
ncbi:neprilysin-1-like [Ixodes scapularis]